VLLDIEEEGARKWVNVGLTCVGFYSEKEDDFDT
jgi:hypothetical protein